VLVCYVNGVVMENVVGFHCEDVQLHLLSAPTETARCWI